MAIIDTTANGTKVTTTYAGCVVHRELRTWADGDLYAKVTVWNAEAKTFDTITLCDPSRPGGAGGYVDADEALMAKYRAWLEAERAQEIHKGTEVVVVAGRKVAKGTKGLVFWVGRDNWGTPKIGMKTEGGETVWIAKANVAAVKGLELMAAFAA